MGTRLEAVDAASVRSLGHFLSRVRDIVNRMLGKGREATPTFQELVDMGVITDGKADQALQARR